MVKDAWLQQYLPDTSLFTPEKLWQYADKYPVVMLKPSGGGNGAGIIQMTKLEEEVYQVHAGSGNKVIAGKDQTLAHIRSLFRPKPYLLQPCISLGKINGRPFDVRVMVQRKRGKPWRMTGWLAKVSGPGFVVPSIAGSRGKVLPLQTAIQLSNVQASSDLLPLLRTVALMVAGQLGKAYPHLRMMGVDLGIDEHGKPWIMEAKFRPLHTLYRKLHDQTYYKRICSYLK
jgi:hypothetical protein